MVLHVGVSKGLSVGERIKELIVPRSGKDPGRIALDNCRTRSRIRRYSAGWLDDSELTYRPALSSRLFFINFDD